MLQGIGIHGTHQFNSQNSNQGANTLDLVIIKEMLLFSMIIRFEKLFPTYYGGSSRNVTTEKLVTFSITYRRAMAPETMNLAPTAGLSYSLFHVERNQGFILLLQQGVAGSLLSPRESTDRVSLPKQRHVNPVIDCFINIFYEFG
jgi:hypothetical protein